MLNIILKLFKVGSTRYYFLIEVIQSFSYNPATMIYSCGCLHTQHTFSQLAVTNVCNYEEASVW